jgi:transcriptional adapter 2-alpha
VNNIPTEEEDVIILGQREIKKTPEVSINVPLDSKRVIEADTRVNNYVDIRKQEINEEELELQKRNQQKQLEIQSLQTHEQKDVGGLVHNKDASRNPKSRSNISAIAACTEVVGYLPKRGDFDQEYDMDAELLLADMEFFEEDTEENIQLKNSVIELYNARLDERIRRKKFVIERGLLDLKRTQKFERKRSKEERDIINSMKIFARFNTEENH